MRSYHTENRRYISDIHFKFTWPGCIRRFGRLSGLPEPLICLHHLTFCLQYSLFLEFRHYLISSYSYYPLEKPSTSLILRLPRAKCVSLGMLSTRRLTGLLLSISANIVTAEQSVHSIAVSKRLLTCCYVAIY